MIKNQIGLDGDVTPPSYMSEIELRHTAAMDPKILLEFGPLKIESRWHPRYVATEYHVTLKLPGRKKQFWDPARDDFPTGRPALFVAFGGIGCSRRGWHARGDIVHWDVKPEVYVFPAPIGYKNPINLANYDK